MDRTIDSDNFSESLRINFNNNAASNNSSRSNSSSILAFLVIDHHHHNNNDDKSSLAYVITTIGLAAAIGLLIFCTIFGNALVILSVALVKRLRTPYNFLIVSLATTDLGIAALIMPMAALPEFFDGDWPLSDGMCDLFICLDMLFCTASILNLAVISLDRYLVITKPFQYGRRRTPRFMLLLVSISWFLSAAVSLPAVFIWKRNDPGESCSYPPNLGFQLYATLIAFFVPTGVIIYVTIRTFFIVSKVVRRPLSASTTDRRNSNDTDEGDSSALTTNNNNTLPPTVNKSSSIMTITNQSSSYNSNNVNVLRRCTGNNHSDNRELKAVNTLGVFLGTFLICWLPFFTLQLVNALRRCGLPHECVPPIVFEVLLWLGYAKSLCNPIVNAFYNREIRRPFVEILCCRCRTLNSTLRNKAYANMYGGRGSGGLQDNNNNKKKNNRLSCSNGNAPTNNTDAVGRRRSAL